MANDCMNPDPRIARSDPDPELTALYAELRRRYPNGEICVYRQLRDDGPSHLSISIDTHERNGNRRASYSLGTDTADRALCCVDEWERKLAASIEPPLVIYAAICRRCGDPINSAQPGLGRGDLHFAKCPKCPEGTKTDVFPYALSKDA